jgi:hypothetical protein
MRVTSPLDPVRHDGRMISSNRWWTRVGAALAAIVVTMLAPAAAWAESTGVAEAVRRRPRFGFGGIFGALCCLVVVGIIVVVVLLVVRNKNRR